MTRKREEIKNEHAIDTKPGNSGHPQDDDEFAVDLNLIYGGGTIYKKQKLQVEPSQLGVVLNEDYAGDKDQVKPSQLGVGCVGSGKGSGGDVQIVIPVRIRDNLLRGELSEK